jgi:antitoxin MazE
VPNQSAVDVDFATFYNVSTFVSTLVVVFGAIMQKTIQKWGNSSAVRIPKTELAAAGLKENDPVSITGERDTGRLIIEKVTPSFKHIPIAQRLAGFTGAYEPENIEVKPVGNEVFW